MKRFLVAAAAAMVPVASASAYDLGCWDTSDIEPNNSPSGTYTNDASQSVDYISPGNEGVGLLLAGLDVYDTASFVICLQGSTTNVDGNTVWQPSSAIICPSSAFTEDGCPE